MEIKRVTEDFGSRGEMSLSTLYEIEDIMYMIEMLFDECDIELTNAGMPTLGYEKQPIGTMRDHLVILLNYVQHAHPQCYNELDHPLYVGFTNGATQALSEIVLEDITTDNTFEMQKYEEIIDVNGHYYRSSTKKKLTMADFLGLDAVVPEEGMPVIENVETIGWFTALFRADYESLGAAAESLDQMLEMYLHSGEYSHKEYHPIGNFVSGILDVTIIKPFIESIYGKDLVTRERLTDFERGMQLVNAAVGAVTLGQGAMALNFAEMSGKEIAAALVKTWAVDAVSDASAYTVGYACDELGMPAAVTFLASLATGCTVSVKAGKYVFQDANSNIVKELNPDEMQTWLKELDADLDDMMWGGGKGTYTTSIDAYESLLGPMSDEELKRYMKFLENGSQAGLTPAELMGIRKVDEYLALGRVDYDEVLTLRKQILWTEEEKRYYKTLQKGSQAGLTQAELLGIQKVDEQLLLNRIDYDEVLALRKRMNKIGSTSRITNKFPNEAMPQDGRVIDYYIENGKIKGIEGINNVDFVVTTDNKLVIGKKHVYLANGQDVLAAGELKINGQGQIKRIDNLSGHYRPTVGEALRYQSLFQNLKLDLNNTWLEYYRIDIDADGMVVDTLLEYTEMLGGKE